MMDGSSWRTDRVRRVVLLLCIGVLLGPATLLPAADDRPPTPAKDGAHEGARPQSATREELAPGLTAATLPAAVRALRVSPDGKTLAVALNDKSLRLLNAASFAEIAQLNLGLRASTADAFAFFPDNRRLAVTSDNALTLIVNTADGSVQATIGLSEDGHLYNDFGLAPLALSPDGKYLAVPDSKSVRIVDAATAKLVATHPLHMGSKGILCFAADNSALAVSADEKNTAYQLFTAPEFSARATVPGARYLTAALQAADGGIVSLSEQKVLQLHNPADGKIVAKLESEKYDIQAFFAQPGSRYVIALRGGVDEHTVTVQLLDAKTLEPRKEFKLEGVRITAAKLSAGDSRLTVMGRGDDRRAQGAIWRVEDAAQLARLPRIDAETCKDVHFADEHTLLFRDGETRVYRWQWQPATPAEKPAAP